MEQTELAKAFHRYRNDRALLKASLLKMAKSNPDLITIHQEAGVDYPYLVKVKEFTLEAFRTEKAAQFYVKRITSP